ncbi:MAG: hypothetical protein KDM91_18735 [Verrucomicrobiae bacterium]|nr:hypothetical protein [Verrucomicrobiae bacterium]MCP5538689.1 hypothetical protein [Akkermansiaceae bacterium]MCP5550578.1 hypothetical protein [Akkermansiaceae bacterium]
MRTGLKTLARLAGAGALAAGLAPGPAFAEPKSFGDSREAVAFARENDRLIAFVMLRDLSDDSREAEAALTAALAAHEKEFVIARCRNGNAGDRTLFTDRFGEPLETFPVLVLATAGGEKLAGATGADPDALAAAILSARQKAKRLTPEEIAMAEEKAKDAAGRLTTGAISIKKGDVTERMVTLSPVRDWKFKDGTTVNAALLDADGPGGTLIRPDGEKIPVQFGKLSAEDIAYLQSLPSLKGER